MSSFPQETYFKQWQTWKAKRCLEKCKTGLPKRGELDRHRVFLLLHSSSHLCLPMSSRQRGASVMCLKTLRGVWIPRLEALVPLHTSFYFLCPHPTPTALSSSTHHLPQAKHFRKVPLSARRHHLHHTDLIWKHPFVFHPELNCSI